jgi:hypothetical protein
VKRILLAALLLSACRADLSVDEKLKQADSYLSEHGGEPGYRAVAYDLYQESLADGNKAEQLRAHFGLGMIGLFDLVQGLPHMLEKDPAKEGDSGDLPPADALARTVDILIHQSVDKGIVAHLGVVAAEDDFTFNFKHLVFPVTDSTQKVVDLSGEWDLTEVRMLYGTAQVVVAVEELGYSYDGLFEAVLKAALSGATLPPLPSNPRDIPAWLVDTAKTTGLEPLPWLDPAFGVLGGHNRMDSVKDRLDKGFGAMSDGMRYLIAEKDSQADDVFPNKKFAGSILTKLLPKDPTLSLVGAAITPQILGDLFEALHAGVTDANKPFILPPSVSGLIEPLLASAYDGPDNLVDLRMPALRLVSFFDNPIADLKSAKDGVLPAFNATGDFVVESEQEPWTDKNDDGVVDDGEYKDTGVDGFVDQDNDGVADFAGRPGAGNGKYNDLMALTGADTLPPLKHKNPQGKIEAANGIVDPLYLFFGDASFHGALVPIVKNDVDGPYEADFTHDYANGDLMRLVSSLIWLVQAQ